MQQWLRKFSVTLVLLLLIFGLCLVCLLAVADMIFEDKDLLFDEHIFALIQPHINDVNTGAFKVITFFGSAAFLLPAHLLLILFFLFFKKNRQDAWKLTAVPVTSTMVLLLLKFILKRQRPLLPLITRAHDYSFPSGHTFSSVVFYGMLAYIMYQYIKMDLVKWLMIIVLVLVILSVGFSRVYLRMHYASDVIAGWCLGVIWLLLARWFLIKTPPLQAS